MKKRILINVIIAFVVPTSFKVLRDYYNIAIRHDNTRFSGTFEEYIGLMSFYTFLIGPLVYLLLVLLPYNLLYLKLKWIKSSSLIVRVVTCWILHLFEVTVIIFLSGSLPPFNLGTLRLIIALLAMSAIVVLILNWLVDKTNEQLIK
ncbi:MAG: hypothetical protein EOO43_13035 [Flavobacterium sp.]|nr:MAG: hypothetical protein EOO43_13035 [Flavobacterium sp.]